MAINNHILELRENLHTTDVLYSKKKKLRSRITYVLFFVALLSLVVNFIEKGHEFTWIFYTVFIFLFLWQIVIDSRLNTLREQRHEIELSLIYEQQRY